MSRSIRLLTPALTLAVVLGIAELHARYIGHYPLTEEPRFAWVLALAVVIWITTYAFGVTEPGLTRSSRLARAMAAVGTAVLFVAVVQLLDSSPPLPRFDLGLGIVILVPLLTAVTGASDRSMAARGPQDRVLALVSPEESERLERDLKRAPERPSEVVCAVDPSAVLPTVECQAPLAKLVAENRATLLVLNREAQSLDAIVSQAAEVHSKGTRVRTLSLFYDEWLGKLPLSELERIALLFDINEIHRPVYARGKRFLDLVLAVPASLALLVAMPLVLLLDVFGNRGNLFYRQPRVGKDGRTFMIVKFRTMRPLDTAGMTTTWTEKDDPRLGTIGRFLRKAHVDELPQVWNVLKRDMSVVGPRPEQPHYVEQLRTSIPFYDVRHLVRPGITGWAQVNYDYGSSEVDAFEKLQYEFFYLRHQDLGLDLRIIGRTLRSVAGGEGR